MSRGPALFSAALLCLCACASPYRKVKLGTATASMGKAVSSQGLEVVQSSDSYQIRYHLSTPRAMKLRYAIRCPGGEHTGTMGETWDSYRQRRLAQLEAQRRSEVNAKASILGAVAGQAKATGHARTADGEAEASATVDARLAGGVIAESTTAPVELSPFDTGAQSVHQEVLLPGGASGSCTMAMWSEIQGQDTQGASGYMEITRLVDRAAEERARQEASDESARQLRARVTATLIANGADRSHRKKQQEALDKQREKQAQWITITVKRQREVQQRQRIAIRKKRQGDEEQSQRIAKRQRDEKQAQWITITAKRQREAQQSQRIATRAKRPHNDAKTATQKAINDDLVAQRKNDRAKRVAALATRRRLVAWCQGNGADIYHRARLRQKRFEQEQARHRGREQQVHNAQREERTRREARQQRLIADLGTREELIAWLIASGADPEYRRKQNEADLLAYEGRARRARDDLRRARHATEEAQALADVTATVDVNVVATTTTVIHSRRPPMPGTPKEARPTKPSPQATWIGGFYRFQSDGWIWVAGTWSTPPITGAIWIPSVEISLGGTIVTRPGSWRTRKGKRVGVQRRDHR